jgi:hypothetical protein
MPLNGSGVYSPPAGSTPIDGDTADAADLTNFVDDIQTVLNTTISVARGGTGATTASAARTNLGITSLSDPGADRILFWDDSAGTTAYLTVGSGLTLSGTSLTADGLADGDKGDITVSSGVWSLDAGVVDTTELADDAVTTDKIADSNVTFAKLAAAAVVTESEGISSNDNDTTIPTSAAVKDYVDDNSGSISGSANSRTAATNTAYQNTQGKPILVLLSDTVSASATLRIEISPNNSTWYDAVRMLNASAGGTTLSASVVVPDTWYWRHTQGGNRTAYEIY